MSGYPKSDARKPSDKQRLLGQVFTPDSIANEMVRAAFNARERTPLEFLDPCVGPYTFPQVAFGANLLDKADRLTLFDLDSAMIDVCRAKAIGSSATHRLVKTDYLAAFSEKRYDVTVVNPPYVRQEWIDKKAYYRDSFKERLGVQVPGTSNLYVYFVVKAISELRPRGRFSMILFDSWQNTRYGEWMWNYLQTTCNNLAVRPAGTTPFQGCLIDATVISGNKAENENLIASSVNRPEDIDGFKQIGDVLQTRRGLRLKQADFFLAKTDEVKRLKTTPFIKKNGGQDVYCVTDNRVQQALIITGNENPNRGVKRELERRLALAKKTPEKNVAILNWYEQSRESWFIHPAAPYAPIIFNYYLRHRPRHLFNPRVAYSDNFYGAIPPDGFSPMALLALLNSTIVVTQLLSNARNQGDGLAKLQLFEYRRTLMPDLDFVRSEKKALLKFHQLGEMLVLRPFEAALLIKKIDGLLASIYPDDRLIEPALNQAYLKADRDARRPRG